MLLHLGLYYIQGHLLQLGLLQKDSHNTKKGEICTGNLLVTSHMKDTLVTGHFL